jgi:hypothetical protein
VDGRHGGASAPAARTVLSIRGMRLSQVDPPRFASPIKTIGGDQSAYKRVPDPPTSRLASTLDRYAVTSERIIRELAKIAFANIGDFIAVQDDGSLVVDFGTATREKMASLKSIEIDERTIDGAAADVRRIKISMSDKRQALMDLAKVEPAAGRSPRARRQRRARRARGA